MTVEHAAVRPYLGTLSAAVAVAALTSCGAPAAEHRMPMPAAASDVRPVAADTVTIAGFAFAPAAVTVPVGSTVTWTNNDSAPHDVTGGPLHSPTLNRGQSWSYTFAAAGSYSYICSIHPNMTGTVTVR
jgi:plastocyanin